MGAADAGELDGLDGGPGGGGEELDGEDAGVVVAFVVEVLGAAEVEVGVGGEEGGDGGVEGAAGAGLGDCGGHCGWVGWIEV